MAVSRKLLLHIIIILDQTMYRMYRMYHGLKILNLDY